MLKNKTKEKMPVNNGVAEKNILILAIINKRLAKVSKVITTQLKQCSKQYISNPSWEFCFKGIL